MANLARWCVIFAALVGAPAAPAQASDSAPEGPPVKSQPPQSPQEAPMQPPPVQQRMAPAPYGAPRRGGGFRAACGFDAERLCAGVPPGGGRIIECLMSYRPRALSPPCRSFIAGRMGAGPGFGRGPGYGPGPSYDPGPAYGPGPGYGRGLGPGAGYGPGAGRNQNGGYPPPYGALPPGPPGSAGTPPPGGQPGNASSRARSTQKTAPGSSTTPSPPEAAPELFGGRSAATGVSTGSASSQRMSERCRLIAPSGAGVRSWTAFGARPTRRGRRRTHLDLLFAGERSGGKRDQLRQPLPNDLRIFSR